MADAGPARAREEGSVQTPKASLGKPEAGDRQGGGPPHPSSGRCTQCLCRLGRGGEKRIRSVFVPTKHLHPHPCTNPCSAPSLPAADRPVMGMHFPQLRALVPGLSSSAWCSQVNERLHNEVITCVRMSAGLAGLGWQGCSHAQPSQLTWALHLALCRSSPPLRAPPLPVCGASGSRGHFL